MIRINNVNISGNSIVIENGRVIIDGVDHTPDSKEISIHVEGNLGWMSIDHCNKIEIAGNVDGKVKTMSGNVVIKGDVSEDVSTMSGNVTCGNVAGKVKTMSGNIRHS